MPERHRGRLCVQKLLGLRFGNSKMWIFDAKFINRADHHHITCGTYLAYSPRLMQRWRVDLLGIARQTCMPAPYQGVRQLGEPFAHASLMIIQPCDIMPDAARDV